MQFADGCEPLDSPRYTVFLGVSVAVSGVPDGRKTNNEVSQVGSDDSGVGPVICQKHLTFACSCCQPDWKEHRQHNHNPRFIMEMVEITPQPFIFSPSKQLQSCTRLLLNWTN